MHCQKSNAFWHWQKPTPNWKSWTPKGAWRGRWKICRVTMCSSSFGIQAAVSLHLVNQIRPDIPVILTDTGYLFPETYQFIDELTDKLKLNLKVYRARKARPGRRRATASCGSRALRALRNTMRSTKSSR
jgi:3'-phosphoadenosine 5'-phosphosulfate sulfotransferase (PAPS reductase)/FAD synthetase